MIINFDLYIVCNRSLEDVNTVLKYAKLDNSDVRPCVQTLFFAENLENDAVKLLELDSDVLDALQSGDRSENHTAVVHFKEQAISKCVLSNKSKKWK